MILQEQGRELKSIQPRGAGVEVLSRCSSLFPFSTFASNHEGSSVENDVACFQE